MKRAKPMSRGSGFARQAPAPRPVKVIEYTPTPRRIAPSTGVAALLAAPEIVLERVDPPDAAGRRHMGRVAALGCAICWRLGYGMTAAEVHHIREGQGGAQRASSFLTIPLCGEHHRGRSGYHGLGARAFERRYGIDELGLLAWTFFELLEGAHA